LWTVVAPAAAAEEAWIPESLEPWLEGLALLHEARETEAVSWFEARRRERPDDPCAWYFLALVYDEFGYEGEDGRPDGAKLIEQGLEIAERNRSDEPGARYCEGALYGMRTVDRVQNGKYLGAALDGKRFRRIMLDLGEEHPEFVDTRFWVGTYDYGADVLPGYIKFFKTLMFLPGGDMERGLEQLEAAAARGVLDRFNAHFLLAGFYQEQGREDDRRRVLEQLVATYPEFPWARVLLAWSLVVDDPPGFERAFALHAEAVARAVARDGEDAGRLLRQIRSSLARLHQRALDHAAAVEILAPLYAAARDERDEGRETALALPLVTSLNRMGRHDEAVEIFEQILERYPESVAIDRLRLMVEQLDGGTGEVYAAAIPARKLARDGKLREAEAAFRRLLERYPDHPEIHFRMGEVYLEAERYAQAEAHFSRAIADEPALPTYVVPYGRLRLGQICDLTDRRREARTYYRLARESAAGYEQVEHTAKRYLKKRYRIQDAE
jgi:tetratricopeptide (TPR) repeat protein